VAILAQARPALVVGVEEGESDGWPALPADFDPDASLSDAPLPEVVPPHERALTSGGSTGAPKLIVLTNPGEYDADAPLSFFKAERVVVVPGPLYHATPFSATFQGLFGGAEILLMPRFDASGCLELIERHRADRVHFVPTMMLRIWRLPEEERTAREVSSLTFVMTGGAPRPRGSCGRGSSGWGRT